MPDDKHMATPAGACAYAARCSADQSPRARTRMLLCIELDDAAEGPSCRCACKAMRQACFALADPELSLQSNNPTV